MGGWMNGWTYKWMDQSLYSLKNKSCFVESLFPSSIGQLLGSPFEKIWLRPKIITGITQKIKSKNSRGMEPKIPFHPMESVACIIKTILLHHLLSWGGCCSLETVSPTKSHVAALVPSWSRPSGVQEPQALSSFCCLAAMGEQFPPHASLLWCYLCRKPWGQMIRVWNQEQR